MAARPCADRHLLRLPYPCLLPCLRGDEHPRRARGMLRNCRFPLAGHGYGRYGSHRGSRPRHEGELVASERLTALDASFLDVETTSAHMHVGWAAVFDPPEGGPPPTFEQLRDHVAS